MSRVRALVFIETSLTAGSVALIGVATLVDLAIDMVVPVGVLTTLLLVAIPGSLWLGALFRCDRAEPSPRSHVIAMLVAGAFILGPIAGFLINHLALGPLSENLDSFALDRLLRALFIVGLIEQLGIYIAIRYVVFPLAGFRDAIDGVHCATAAGIGLATHQNWQILDSVGQVHLTNAIALVTTTALAQAAFAGIIGYALGQAKATPLAPAMRNLALSIALFTAVFLSGQFTLVGDLAYGTAMKLSIWRKVAYTAGFASVLFLVTTMLARRAVAGRSTDAPEDGEAPPETEEAEETKERAAIGDTVDERE